MYKSRIFDPANNAFEIITESDITGFINDMLNKRNPYKVEYKKHIYYIDPWHGRIKHISGDTSIGAMYYGYSYLTELLLVLMIRDTLETKAGSVNLFDGINSVTEKSLTDPWSLCRDIHYYKEIEENACEFDNRDEQNQVS